MEGRELSEANSGVTIDGFDEHISRAKAMANTASIYANVWPHLGIFFCFQSFSIKCTPHRLAHFETNHGLLLPVAVMAQCKSNGDHIRRDQARRHSYSFGGNYDLCFIVFTSSFWFVLTCQEHHRLEPR